MSMPKIQALGITQEGSSTRWKATGYVEGMGWLEAWGKSLVAAMEALQAEAARRLATPSEEDGTQSLADKVQDTRPPCGQNA